MAIHIAALWNKKAAQWVEGRKNWMNGLQTQLSNEEKIIWVHCASAGEFEQGKPVIEALKQDYQQYKILVTFFSPSGFSAAKKYGLADFKTYLPLDTAFNAAQFLKIVKPKLVVFVKYDYWYHHLNAVASQQIPLVIISAIFRPNQLFFKAYGTLHRRMLHFFSHIFVQDDDSLKRLQAIDINHGSVAGDTRFDRVYTIAAATTELPLIEKFIHGKKVLVAGSTWPDDEDLLTVLNMDNIKLIIAPHEINKSHLEKIRTFIPQAIFYSEAASIENIASYPVLVIDNIGMLSQLYAYASISYIGGGFNKSGIHNTLEAAVWGRPVLFGPNYKKFKEARDLISEKGGFSVCTKEEFKNKIDELLANSLLAQQMGLAAKNYVADNKGATQKIMDHIQENRLLTRL